MYQVNYNFISCIFLALILPSTSFYIQTFNQNYTTSNGAQVNIYYQPAFCIQANDVCDPNEIFNITVQVGHQCLPTKSISYNLSCPIVACEIPSQYLNCTNTFTGQNNYTIFLAIITMTSNTNASHNAFAPYTKNVTWIDTSPKPIPIPTPDNNSSSDWPIYVGVSVGVVVLAVIGFIIFKKIQKRKQDSYERV